MKEPISAEIGSKAKMAYFDNKFLFFTTSSGTPAKMIPEIALLHEKFHSQSWNTETQSSFIDDLTNSEFFEELGAPSDKSFSVWDRINRHSKASGFVDFSLCRKKKQECIDL